MSFCMSSLFNAPLFANLDFLLMYVSFRGETGKDEPTPISNLQSFDVSGNIITKVRLTCNPT
jgi:hypothetical protein